MATVTVTAAEVLPTATTEKEVGIAGETLTAGMSVYKKSSDANAWWKADADTAAEAQAGGIALCGASDGQYVVVATDGDIDPGFTCTVGETYIVAADVAGGIAPIGDLLAGDYATILGVATSASNLKLNVFPGGTARA